MKWRALVMFFFIAASGCSPRVDLRIRQRLLPSPSPDCIESALARSPDVVQPPRVERALGSEIFWVLLRDSTANEGQRTVTVAMPALRIPDGKLELTFVSLGARRPPKAEEDALIDLGSRVLARLRRACAPQTPTRIECDYGDGRVWQCTQTG